MHTRAMRTHFEIIRDAGGFEAVARRLGLEAKRLTVRSWAVRNSIPGAYWQAFAEAGLATLSELAAAAAAAADEAV